MPTDNENTRRNYDKTLQSVVPTQEKVLGELFKGKITLSEVGESLDAASSAKVRRKFIEKEAKTTLNAISSFSFDAAAASTKNAENLIGAAHVPLGAAGPLKVSGEFAKGSVYIPLATTEGALIASVSRGAKAITDSGGATVRITADKMTRAPVFKTSGITHSIDAAKWIQANFPALKKTAESTTKFGELKALKTWSAGKSVYARFEFDTKDAMGMNMVTIACDAMSKLIEEKTKARCISVSGNMCVDKKPSALTFIEGRGKTVLAEAVIKRDVVNAVLKTTPEEIVEVNYRKNIIGSALSGSLGYNAHFANMVAALYIATGQDPAHVVEGSLGMTNAEMDGKDLYISVYMPSVNVGTIGGGTGLATQKEALSILGCAGATAKPGENAKKLAEIVAATVLAGELSTLAAQATGQLGSSHAKLGRGK